MIFFFSFYNGCAQAFLRFGTYSTTEAIKAGLDLEMPGPTSIRGNLIKNALGCRKLLETDVDERVREVLKMVKRTESLKIPEHAPEKTLNNENTAALLRRLASEGIVLLKNARDILPFSKSRSVAVIGPNANYASYCGGGSASLQPYYAVSPLEGIKNKVADVKYALGAVGWKKLPLLSRQSKTQDGRQGLSMRIYLDPPTCIDREVIDEVHVENSDILLVDYKHPRISGDLYYCELDAIFTPSESAEYEFGLTVAGTGKLLLDDTIIVDNETSQVPGDSFFGFGTIEQIGSVQMHADQSYKVTVRFGTAPTRTYYVTGATAMGAGGLRIGCEKKTGPEDLIREATKIAAEVDQVIICAGLNSDWESEGYDRENMDLPPYSDKLIEAVTRANENTVVVIQSGTPVTMSWVDRPRALLQAWYGGNEAGNAIADVIFGDFNPSGKMPLTFPFYNEDNPAFLNFRSERGRVLYGEDVYVGYRHYETIEAEDQQLFFFGDGLSYTKFTCKDFELEDSAADGETSDIDAKLRASITVVNEGTRAGAEVVQCYVPQRNPSIRRPAKELKGFQKVFLEPSEKRRVSITMSKKYAASFWDEDKDMWIMEDDEYEVRVGNSMFVGGILFPGDIGTFRVKETVWWKGL